MASPLERLRAKGTGTEGVKRIAQRLSRRAGVSVCAVTVAATLAACAVPNDMVPTYPSSDALTVAPSEVIGHEVLTDVYALALRREGVLVEIAEPAGTTTDATDKVLAGTSDFTIGYSGQLLDDVEGADSSGAADSAMSATEVYDQLEASIPDTVSVGPAARGQDKPVVVVTEHTSTTMNVRTMSDLSGRCGELRLAVSPQTALAPEVRSALRGYDCQFSDVVTDYPNPTEIREALRRGDVGAGITYSSDPALFPPDMIRLDDDRNLIQAQTPVPVFASGSLSEEDQKVLAKVSRKMSTQEMIKLNAAVESGRTHAIAAASGWLNDNGFESSLDAG